MIRIPEHELEQLRRIRAQAGAEAKKAWWAAIRIKYNLGPEKLKVEIDDRDSGEYGVLKYKHTGEDVFNTKAEAPKAEAPDAPDAPDAPKAEAPDEALPCHECEEIHLDFGPNLLRTLLKPQIQREYVLVVVTKFDDKAEMQKALAMAAG
jgi:hypothetical protein